MRVYTLDEVAETLQITKKTLYAYVRGGTLPAVKLGRVWRITEDSLKAFLETGAPVADANRGHNKKPNVRK